MALGASARQIFTIVITHSLRIAAIGAAIAIPLSFALTRVLGQVLYGGRAADSLIIVAVAGVLVMLGLVAALGPAWRAAHADPMHAVRAD
jgi:ABC-type antimicrobial peptide transport system permease subunit